MTPPPSRRKRRKKAGESLTLPFEEFTAPAPASLSPVAPDEKRKPPSPPSEAAALDPAFADDWGQMTLWADVIPPHDLSTPPSPAPTTTPAATAARPDSETPASAISVPSEPASTPVQETAPRRTKAEPKKNDRTPAHVVDEGGIESAAEALGLDLEELQGVARENEFRAFWSALRAQAAKRVRHLRETKTKDPFAWESAGMAVVPAFVENRAAVEILYHSLRNEENSLF